MTEQDWHNFQRQELTVKFSNDFPLTAPMSHWLGAMLAELPHEVMQRVAKRVLNMREKPPVAKAKIHLPPSMRDLEESCNHGS